MRTRFKRILPTVVDVAGRYGLRALFHTLRVQSTGREDLRKLEEAGTPVIFVFWHGQLLPLIHVHRHDGVTVLVSEHRDGELVTGLIHHFGFGTVRGSSTRGAVRGLKGLIRAARSGRSLAITPDGPQGPNRRLKLGALTAARMTGLPLLPIGVGVSSAWRARSWDGLLVPKPFSTVRVAYGRPSFVSRDASPEEVDGVAASLERELLDLSALVGDTPAPGHIEGSTGPVDGGRAQLVSEVSSASSPPFGDPRPL